MIRAGHLLLHGAMLCGPVITTTPTRRLAAILVADVVGYSRLMEADEAGIVAALRERRETILEPVVKEHGGRIVKFMGDGVLVEFASAVNALKGALELQNRFAAANVSLPQDRRVLMRIGVNLGDVIGEGADIYGEGVNIAARLESMAEPGGVCISGKVHDEVRGKLAIVFEDGGEQSLKNISTPVRLYHYPLRPGKTPFLELPDRPSIAILPFLNMSNDPQQEPFADGLTEDLITDLSRNAGLFVIARNSSFVYKQKSVDAREIARQLGVRYLIEGSARRAAGRVRINVQLIDAISGAHLWAERYDRNLDDVFAVQDEVTAKIVEALIGRLMAPPPRQRPKNLEAHDLCVRAREIDEHTPQASREAHLLIKRALTLDPGYAVAHRCLALNLWLAWCHWGGPVQPNRQLSVESAERAVALDPNDAGNHWTLAHVYSYERRFAESEAAFATTFAIDPNHANAWAGLSDITVLDGRTAEGLEQILRAMRLNPHPPIWYYLLLGQAQYAVRDFDAAVATLSNGATYRSHSRRFLAASLAQLGRIEEARREAEMFMITYPHFTISSWVANQPWRDPATLELIVEGYRKAGLPE